MNIFLDTNAFLSFYHLSSDDLEELKKLAVLVRQGEVTLFVPEQVIDEFKRNRASKIADALKRLDEHKYGPAIPQMAKQYEEYELLRDSERDASRHHSRIVERIREDAAANSLEADAVIDELFVVAEVTETTEEIFSRARRRMELGKPPGKRGSLGDAINWEALLEAVPDGADLHFIADDNDFFSPLERESLDPYLQEEWQTLKGSTIHSYRRLSSLFSDEFPDIDLATELEKDILIRELATSSNFSETHQVIDKLSRFSEFTSTQLNDIVRAAATNDQIYWIAGDPDVHQFISSIVHGREELIEEEYRGKIEYFLTEIEPYGEIPD